MVFVGDMWYIYNIHGGYSPHITFKLYEYYSDISIVLTNL